MKLPEGWEVKTLGDVARVTSGGTPSRNVPEYWNGHIPWVTTAEVCFGTIYSSAEKITQKGMNESSAKLFPVDTLLMAMYGQGKTRGQVGKLGIEATTNQACAAILLNSKQSPDFHYYYLQSQYEAIRGLSNGGSQDNLSSGLVKTIQVPIPPLPEQKKIAEILSTWDAAIAASAKLLENSQQQKRALMQQLLTGKKRLPGCTGEWQEVRLGELIKEVKRPVNWDDAVDYRLLSVKRRSEGVVLREVLKGHQILTKKMNTAHAGDFIISKMQIVHGAMGLVTEQFDGHHISDSYIAVNAKNQNKLSIEFFDWFCKQKAVYQLAFESSSGVHIEKMTFNFEDFLKKSIFMPLDREEQQSIAAILTTADQGIAALQQQLDRLKQEKQALMQELLTGKRRVKTGGSAS